MSPKDQYKQMSNEELRALRADYKQRTDTAAPILAMNPIPGPFKQWMALRDANQEMLHLIALIDQELRTRKSVQS